MKTSEADGVPKLLRIMEEAMMIEEAMMEEEAMMVEVVMTV